MNRELYLVELAERLYTSCGIKSTTIDELCQQAGMSKKTFYLYHRDKDELVCKVLRRVISRLKQEIERDAMGVSDINSRLEQQKQLLRRLAASKSIFNDHVLMAYREARTLVDEFKQQFLRTQVESDLRQGVQRGWYRPDISIDRLADVFMFQVGMLLNQSYPLDLACEAQELYLYGLMTSLARAQVIMN